MTPPNGSIRPIRSKCNGRRELGQGGFYCPTWAARWPRSLTTPAAFTIVSPARSTAASNARKYGAAGAHRNSHDNFVLAAGKHGLSVRDVGPCISFFAPVVTDDAGRLSWRGAARKPGDYVDLRAEMNLIVALSNCPHPLDPESAGTRRGGRARRLAKRGCAQERRLLSQRHRRGTPCIREYRCAFSARPRFMKKSSNFDPATAVYDHVIPARTPWSGLVRKGQSIRIVDSFGQQSADTLFYNAHNHAERYDAQATLAAQGSAYVSAGTTLLSNEGRALVVVTADTSGDHDTSAGACSCESNTVRFGHHTRYMHACRENFLVEVARHGMDKRDIVGQHQFLHERTGAAERRPRDRGWTVKAGGLCRTAGGDGRVVRHLQLPAGEQSLQRL